MTLLCFALVFPLAAQDKLEKTLKRWNHESLPYIHVDEIDPETHVLFLDTRTREEYEVSHLKGAVWVGHKKFKTDTIENLVEDKTTDIVVYCSIGIRSEDVGEQLLQAGYPNVKNLYGGIFEWKNRGHPVYGPDGNETQKVHAYNRKWGKFLKNGEKIYKTPSSVRNKEN